MMLAVQEAYIASGFGERAFHNTTTLHPIGALAFLAMTAWMLAAKRRNALLPVLLLAASIPTAQRVIVATLDLGLLRLIVLFGLLRVIAMGEYRAMRLHAADKIVLAWTAVALLAWVALRGSFSAFVYKVGLSFDILGIYFLARAWIRDAGDIDRVVRTFALLSIPFAAFFFIEHITGRNLFSVFGGASPITPIRDGRLRCQGPYVHPILAGSFWAVLFPVFAARWRVSTSRWLTIASMFSAAAITYFSSSSTPILVLAASLFGLGLYRLRWSLGAIRWAVLVGMIVIHFAREKPVWHLLARVSVVGGSTGYHRYRLIDAAINHFSEWFLIGTKSTAHWGYYLFDVTNQYVLEGVSGGALGLFLFLALIVSVFRSAGRVMRRSVHDPRRTALVWGVGVLVFAHCAMFLAVSIYFAPQNLSLMLVFFAALISLDQNTEREARRGRARPMQVEVPRAARPKRLWREPPLTASPGQ